MTVNTYPSFETVRSVPGGGTECQYCGQVVIPEGFAYHHLISGQRRCDPVARNAHERYLSDNALRS
ncbi:hypothetical protein LQL77_32085 [Rhodococcus cerastii]|nr:hypothetical protein [Rhodococcus cerastii]